jgi:hypothetical protein
LSAALAARSSSRSASSTASASDQQLMMATSRLFGLHDPGDANTTVATTEGEREE